MIFWKTKNYLMNEKNKHYLITVKTNHELMTENTNHSLITEKFNLLMVMQKWCDLNKENVFDIMPVTFYVEMPNVQKETAYN